MKITISSLSAVTLFFAAPALAQQLGSHYRPHHGPVPTIVAQAPLLTDGEVRKVDKETKKLTVKHGPIANLDMPAMTMVYQVKDPAMLDQVKAGDRIRFRAEKVGGAYTVTHIEK